MKVVLLCPGPSLSRYVPRPADLTIGVNRAAIAFRCDIWAALDVTMIAEHGGAVSRMTKLLTSEDAARVARRDGTWSGEFVIAPVTSGVDIPPYDFPSGGGVTIKLNWNLFTASMALTWAGINGAREIDIYGADWRGTQDWDGTKAGSNRGDMRWVQECNLVTKGVIPWLASRGIVVNRRISPDHEAMTESTMEYVK